MPMRGELSIQKVRELPTRKQEASVFDKSFAGLAIVLFLILAAILMAAASAPYIPEPSETIPFDAQMLIGP